MKQLKLLLLTICVFGLKDLKAAETEPNNTKLTATVLALNSNNNGTINVDSDVDWWQVTTNADGNLNITITISNSKTLRCYIYDTDGITVLNSGYSSNTITVSADGLAAGIYYIKLVPYSVGQLADYTVSNSLVLPAEANDAEPNGSRNQALVLLKNKSTKGHVGYYYNLQRDSADWYKITTDKDGLLRVTVKPGNGHTTRIYLYDNNGTTLLNSSYSSSAATINQDGLAAGTYYVKIFCYTSSDFAPYTLSDSLLLPAQVNDIEPNNTKAEAKLLPVNESKTGHAGYYYNLQRDTADWYKITTNADGLLRVTAKPGNGHTTRIYLYDNNGTTLLNSTYSSSAAIINQDGLAAGTYYVKISCYTGSDFAPYTLSDSLFLPAQANDIEPNNTRAQAKLLPVNESKTGHAGYYYNILRDTADWYKVTTNTDGLLRVTVKPGNGTTMRIYLYDNDGTTLLGSTYSSSAATVSKDGAAPGTYYVKIFCYSGSDFAPYTLSDSLFIYDTLADQEPNKYASQAKTIPANETTEGHVGFYYNKVRDSVDWWKINYTGSGDLDFTISQETLLSGGTNTLRFLVYKDTASAAIHSSYSSAANRVVHLSALTQGYYWIKIYTYTNSDFSSYALSNTFTQVNIAAIKAFSYDSAADCASANSITYRLNKSKAPYTVQLYRFNTAYGGPVTTKKKEIIFTDLPTGAYYATVYGDGATGTAFGVSKNASIEPVPSGLSTTNIKSKQAKLNWNSVNCAGYFTVQYKVHGSGTWKKKFSKGNINSVVLSGLVANTQYDWRVAATDSANNVTATGLYADSISFTTTAAFASGADDGEDALVDNEYRQHSIIVAPNPASSYFKIHYNQAGNNEQNVVAQLFDASGNLAWSSGLMKASYLNGKQVNVSNLTKGVFYLKILTENNVLAGSTKVIISK